MEYEFRKDMTGELQAIFSMGCEAMGAWLTEEVGKHTSRLQPVYGAIKQLEAQQGWEYSFEGVDYNLILTRTEATARNARIDFDYDDDLEDDMDFYDQEATASCGLADFKTMLEDWEAFIHN